MKHFPIQVFQQSAGLGFLLSHLGQVGLQIGQAVFELAAVHSQHLQEFAQLHARVTGLS